MGRCNDRLDRHTVAKSSIQKLIDDWKDKLAMPNQYSANGGKFIPMRTENESIQDSHLGFVEAVQHRTQLKRTDRRLIHSAPYNACDMGRESEKRGTYLKLTMEAIEPAHTQCPPPIGFVRKKDGTLHFCIEVLKLNAVVIWNSKLKPFMNKCINLPGHLTNYRQWTQTVDTD